MRGGWRSPASHVNTDGTPKVAYQTEGEARERADEILRNGGRRQWTYRCAQGPEHYHLTKNQPDLTPR